MKENGCPKIMSKIICRHQNFLLFHAGVARSCRTRAIPRPPTEWIEMAKEKGKIDPSWTFDAARFKNYNDGVACECSTFGSRAARNCHDGMNLYEEITSGPLFYSKEKICVISPSVLYYDITKFQ